MNYKQIRDLYRTDEWFRCLSHKIDRVFEVQEEYVYDSDFGVIARLPKGLKLVFKGIGINEWYFSPKETKDLPNINKLSFGKSRLLKLKLKEIQPSLLSTTKEEKEC